MQEPWDETLARIDRTDASSQAGERFGAANTPAFVSTGANLIFRFTAAGGGTRYLRLIHAALRDAVEINSNAAYQMHLSDAGAPVSRLVRSAAGRAVETLEVGGELVLATAVEAVPGRPVEPAPDEYAAWGRALGRMHRAAESFELPTGCRLRDWTDEWNECVACLRPDDLPARAEVERLEAWLRELPRGTDAMGMTHGDCNRTNALFDGGEVRIIDFDEPTHHWFLADVARPFRELTPEDPSHDDCLDALLAGYREERSLDEALEAAIPDFVRMKNLEMYGWLTGRQNWAGDELPGGRDRAALVAAARKSFGWE